ncbi:hypothetical protein QMW88_21850 [Cronobacter dublinensis]|uniref:hypothetical protein n=1 Tax=Cronobacter dublinensis TaxID=413497 RepID=UPI000CFBBD41|nr:hypothetical protein [Cronobacter dublinensis]MDK1195059.1 hypothetical protein [Cronobacter dublinensis]MDK1203868.1 hypothetical protein [Cronobacter dublinensis]
MTNQKLNEIEKFLAKPDVFDFLKALYVDEALDSRDEPEFDKSWMGNFNLLKGENFDASDIAQIDSLREKAFKLSFRALNDSEVASRISDDIELIAKNIIIGKEDSWAVSYLWTTYKNGAFPV